ncbi:MAG TPA: proline dehydrogenase family protein [Motilibacteraceae bacterium]|nr:proline dehydrogenase family protein [Motilibacteraceae bacterium]
MIRSALLAAARSSRLKDLSTSLPVSSGIVSRFVAGERLDDAVAVVRELTSAGLQVSLDHLGEDTLDAAQAAATRDAYLDLLKRLDAEGLAQGADVSVKLSAVGQALPGDGEKVATENAHAVCAAAKAVGATVTLDMEDHTTTDSTLSVLRALREDFPTTGAVLQAYLHRTEADCRDLATEGSRVRLCKGAYAEPASVAFQDRDEVDRSYVRCLKVLMAGKGYPMIASHDPRLIDVAGALALRNKRQQGTYEYQMLHGIRPDEQRRLAAAGETMRVYVPYGGDWYGYFMRRLAERPANVAFFLRSLATKS